MNIGISEKMLMNPLTDCLSHNKNSNRVIHYRYYQYDYYKLMPTYDKSHDEQ